MRFILHAAVFILVSVINISFIIAQPTELSKAQQVKLDQVIQLRIDQKNDQALTALNNLIKEKPVDDLKMQKAQILLDMDKPDDALKVLKDIKTLNKDEDYWYANFSSWYEISRKRKLNTEDGQSGLYALRRFLDLSIRPADDILEKADAYMKDYKDIGLARIVCKLAKFYELQLKVCEYNEAAK